MGGGGRKRQREGNGGWRDGEREGQTGRERGGERERRRKRQTHTENENENTLILKDCSVRSIWTYLTASPCYSTNASKHDDTTNRD